MTEAWFALASPYWLVGLQAWLRVVEPWQALKLREQVECLNGRSLPSPSCLPAVQVANWHE